ncbi:MAG: DUF2306 domain-containing protein [Pseudomonadota bacterium]
MFEEFTQLSFWVHSAAGKMHFFGAITALILGPLVLIKRKGGFFHRAVGGTYVLVMLSLNFSALTIFGMGRFNLFHLFALISLATLIPGMVAISQAVRTRNRAWFQTHAHLMVWSYYGLVMAGAAQLFYRTIPRITGTFETVDNFWTYVMPISTLLTVFLTNRYIPRSVERMFGPAPAKQTG